MKISVCLLVIGFCLAANAQGPTNIIESIGKADGPAGSRSLIGGASAPQSSTDFVKAKTYWKMCPKYSLVSGTKCPKPRYCNSVDCRTTVGYYCGLPFQLYYHVAGTACRNEYERCSASKYTKCDCRTTFKWKYITKAVINHDGLLYFVPVWVRVANGCECYGKPFVLTGVGPHHG